MTDVHQNEVTNVLITPVHTDDRGSIFDLVEDKVGHVGMVTFTTGSVRGNHYHKVSVQYSYVLSGELELTTSQIDGSDSKTEKLVPGTLSRIPPLVIHTYKALTDAEMLDIVTLSRTDDGYESDTVRMQAGA
jgi:quercetin dioxygenase-like cupin family protein